MIQFDLPKNQSSIIKVIGIGGGGSNAVNHMQDQNIEAVDFIICNTDAQALAKSNVPNKIQLGPQLTSGLGAGAKPEVGRQATEESIEEIKKILEVNTKMAFVTAGMGGGTGTGGAPILAKLCKDLGILTVGIVTTPFAYEGNKRMLQATEGINEMKDHVDTLLVISNDKVRHQYGNLKVKEAFAKADNVLATAAKCITDVINSTGQINVDFADVCTVMKNGGVAILGSGNAAGEDRAQVAIENALNSPLLNDNDIHGAKWILININSAEGEHEFTMDEVEVIQNFLRSQSGEDSDVILGLGYDNTLGDQISVTIIATGFEHKNIRKEVKPKAEIKKPVEKVMLVLGSDEQHIVKDEPAKPEVDPLMPTLNEYQPLSFDFEAPAQAPPASTEPKEMLSLSADDKSEPEYNPSSFLKKPEQIYAEEPVKEQEPKETPLFTWVDDEKEEDNVGFTMVEKSEPVHEPAPEPVSQPIFSYPETQQVVEAAGDNDEDLRRRALERINKLRGLSFNMNATSDPSDEFESVPAYLRRNMEMQNQIADVENFYSNYNVKANDSNQAEISTINTYLDGRKPD